MQGLNKPTVTHWFTLVGVIITAALGVVANQRTVEIHSLVNSQFSQAKAEIREGKIINAVLLKRIAKLTGTTEDEIRAEIALEISKEEVALPRDVKK